VWYAVFELAFVVLIVAIVTAPFWAKDIVAWMNRPFGAPKETNDRERREPLDKEES